MLMIIYEALKSIKELGLSYNSIHTWTNGCVFFMVPWKIQECV